MAMGPNSTWRMKIAEWVSATVAIVTLAILCYSAVSEAKAQQSKDQVTNDIRFSAIVKWQDEAFESRKEMFRLLYEIKATTSRIEGQISK